VVNNKLLILITLIAMLGVSTVSANKVELDLIAEFQKFRFDNDMIKAKQGDANAQYNIAKGYRMGEGISVDDEKSFLWSKKAARQGHGMAQLLIGTLYLLGEGTLKDDKKAFYWFIKAAEQGDADAQFMTGLLYGKGEGTLKDDKKGFYWIKKAADKNHKEAQTLLGLMYKTGEVVEEGDYIKAVKFFTLACEQGQAKACGELAGMYIYGISVDKDMKKAKDLIAKAYESDDLDVRKKAKKKWNEFELWKY